MLGSCAGLIMLDREHLSAMDILARRNAFGRQVASFEADLEIAGVDGPPLRAIFIRAPWVEDHGPGVEILASVRRPPRWRLKQDRMIAVAFHAELGDDDRLHRRFPRARGGGRADQQLDAGPGVSGNLP